MQVDIVIGYRMRLFRLATKFGGDPYQLTFYIQRVLTQAMQAAKSDLGAVDPDGIRMWHKSLTKWKPFLTNVQIQGTAFL